MESVEKAEEIVRRLTRKYGHLDDEMMSDIEKWKPEYRREIDENWLAIENTAAHSIKTLVNQFLGSGARFVFELLQNADDNKFFTAVEEPYISFKVYEDRIVVDCNEDGFTERDLGAICAVGQSTKSASYGYSGAKGIGFKSVFIAAWKVHIQSGNFSFEFRHKRDDLGPGMVRPIWVPTEKKLKGPLTRMTLYFHDKGDPNELRRLKSNIFKQLDDLNQTSLVSLKNIQRIMVVFYGKDDRVERSKVFLMRAVDKHRIALETHSAKGNETRKESQIYHITSLIVQESAKSDSDLPNTNDTQTMSTFAEVTLAFPLTPEIKPLVNTKRKQRKFTFLPVRESGCQILIHSDSHTRRNLQDLITMSTWNEYLLEWIAEAFLGAIKQFCEHDTLCYDWPLFLPTIEDATSIFWEQLSIKIIDLIKENPVLRSRRQAGLRLMSDLFMPAKDEAYGEGRLIFDDPVRDPFISPRYSSEAKQMLVAYGLRYLTRKDMLAFLESDLRSFEPRLHGTQTSEDWHSALADLLCSWFDGGFAEAARLKELALIPLRNGGWTSAASDPVYFPITEGVAIPESLDIPVIRSTAISNISREKLFKHLGVSEADVTTVRALILKKMNGLFDIFLPRHYQACLHYLYLTHRPRISTTAELAKVAVVDNKGNRCRPHETDIYLPGTTHPSSPEFLLTPNGAAPGFFVPFIHDIYMNNPPKKPDPDHPSWERWLFVFVGIREQLRFVNSTGEALSEAVLYVHKYRPELFLELLRYLWGGASSEVKENQILRRNIKALSAKDLCGVSSDISLGQTWLPFENLCQRVSLYMDLPTHFPFLKIDNTGLADQFRVEWSFLAEYFDVSKEDNLAFYMSMIDCIQISHPKAVSTRQSQNVFDLYNIMYAKLILAGSQPQDQSATKNFFMGPRIFLPGAKSIIWTTSSNCLWLAPPDMLSKHSLQSLYMRNAVVGDQLKNIEHLLNKIVEIPSASWPDIVNELETMRMTGCNDFERIDQLYRYLRRLTPPKIWLRDVFAKKPLIYAKSRGRWRWCKISDCLWSSPIDIRVDSITSNTNTDFGGIGAVIALSPGTAIAPFKAFIEVQPSSITIEFNVFQNISFQDPYRKWSADELRLADYVQGRRPPGNPSSADAFGVGSGFTSIFSSANQKNTTGGLFKVTLDSDYETLKDFFVEMLGITSLTAQMVYDELKHPFQQRDINELKDAVLVLSSLLKTSLIHLDPQPILDSQIFPLKHCNREIGAHSTKVEFAIPDTEYLNSMFREEITMLDFNLESTHRLRPFFEWTKLQGRYLSTCVTEDTSVSEAGLPISTKIRDLKRKAHPILRIAATFSSPRYKADPLEFYHLLRTMKTMEIAHISSTLVVSQNDKKFCVENVDGDQHIEYTSSGLTIYVPQERKPQAVCFSSVLPRRFAEWIMQDPATQNFGTVESGMVNTLAAVLACDVCDRSVLDEICNRNGIVPVEVPNEDIKDDCELEDSDVEEEYYDLADSEGKEDYGN